MNIKEDIARQEAAKRKLKGIGVKTAPKMRIATKERVKAAEKAQGKALLTALHDGKRAIPSDWERGYNAAMSIVANAIDAK